MPFAFACLILKGEGGTLALLKWTSSDANAKAENMITDRNSMFNFIELASL
jgi:hypothetical protein